MTKNILRSSIRQFKAEGNKNFKNLEARIDVSSKEKMCLECDGLLHDREHKKRITSLIIEGVPTNIKILYTIEKVDNTCLFVVSY